MALLNNSDLGADSGALSIDDIEESFSAVVNEKLMAKSPWSSHSNSNH